MTTKIKRFSRGLPVYVYEDGGLKYKIQLCVMVSKKIRWFTSKAEALIYRKEHGGKIVERIFVSGFLALPIVYNPRRKRSIMYKWGVLLI